MGAAASWGFAHGQPAMGPVAPAPFASLTTAGGTPAAAAGGVAAGLLSTPEGGAEVLDASLQHMLSAPAAKDPQGAHELEGAEWEAAGAGATGESTLRYGLAP